MCGSKERATPSQKRDWTCRKQATGASSAQELNVLIETLILTHTRLASVSSSCKAFIMLGKALPKRLQQHQGGSLKVSRTCNIAFNPASGQSHQTTPDKKGLTELFTWRGAMALLESACFGNILHPEHLVDPSQCKEPGLYN